MSDLTPITPDELVRRLRAHESCEKVYVRNALLHDMDLRGAELADEAMGLSLYDLHYGLFIRTKSMGRFLDGDLAAALELIDYALIVRPGWFQNHYLKAAILSEMGDQTRARASFAEGEGMIGAYSDDAFVAGHPFGSDSDLARFASALNQVGGRFLN